MKQIKIGQGRGSANCVIVYSFGTGKVIKPNFLETFITFIATD